MAPGGMHEKFMNLRTKIQMLGGGFGNGKTAASCVKAIQLALDYPGSNGLIARETYPKLNDTIRKEFFKWCPRSIIQKMPTQDNNTCYLKNGSMVNFPIFSRGVRHLLMVRQPLTSFLLPMIGLLLTRLKTPVLLIKTSSIFLAVCVAMLLTKGQIKLCRSQALDGLSSPVTQQPIGFIRNW